VQSKSTDLDTILPSVPSLGHKREIVLARCELHYEKFASEGALVGATAMALFHKIARTKKGILLVLLLIMSTLIESVDAQDTLHKFLLIAVMLP
jgi:hypothetical protein